ncbi:V-type immunoglobulin domain-containing suppressor of T-cell activation [Genypterus blacodes]|uniref:V-type immunoglobulin domain-containing suppressor of T-cell activation n=1 Tax=Genypterus blacodes TaxID=154954 RepID=UPI003F7700C4
MPLELPCQSPRFGVQRFFWLLSAVVYMNGANGDISHTHSTLSVAAPHLSVTCPEGATAQLMCTQRGQALHSTDVVRHAWLFTPHSDQPCHDKTGPRHAVVGSHGSLPPGVRYESKEQNFWVVLQNVTRSDQGRYCCMVLDFQVEHQHGTLQQRLHNHVVLHITPRRNGSQECTVWDQTPPAGSVPVALAVSACIMALLSMPLILMLVYKQRQNAHSSRRGHELVRMDSEAQGHENPSFHGASPKTKTRTVSQIMTRQSSDSGRHLMSEPGTPLSPQGHGDVFFPIHDAIPESPDFLQV